MVNAIPLGKDADGEPIVVRNGRYGPYVRRGEDTASVPEDLAPDELTVERALELLAAPKGDDAIGTDPATGPAVFAKRGRFGPYVQLGDADTRRGREAEDGVAVQDHGSSTITLDDALQLLSLPRTVGADPRRRARSWPQTAGTGPYVKKGDDTRSLDTEEQLFTVTLDEALAPVRRAQARGAGAGGRPAAARARARPRQRASRWS